MRTGKLLFLFSKQPFFSSFDAVPSTLFGTYAAVGTTWWLKLAKQIIRDELWSDKK